MSASAIDKTNDKNIFGFWLYIMTDCVLFASVFAAFVVLRSETYGGPSGRDLFDLHYVLIETLLLLTSSFTAGIAMLAVHANNKKRALLWFAVTFLLGAAFLVMEVTEFRHLVIDGHSWRTSGFLSGYFTLVGMHGLHITAGLFWMFVMMLRLNKRGFINSNVRKLTMLSLFWHFLDIVWIFIFTIVYLIGVLPK